MTGSTGILADIFGNRLVPTGSQEEQVHSELNVYMLPAHELDTKLINSI
jgi:hypothetical protein